MAIDTKGAIIGGLAGGGVGAVIGGSGLFSKKSVPTYNPAFANAKAEQGGAAERQNIADYMAGTKANEGTFRTDVQNAGDAAKLESQSAAQDYLQNFDPITSRIVQQRTDALKRSTFGAIPELVQAAREAGAAGGGLDRGVIQSQLAGIPTEQARQFGEGASQLETQALSQQLDARSKVFDSSNQLILNKLGIDANAAQSILNSGNQALIQQLNDLIDESRNRIGIQINADSAAQGSQAGAIANENNNKQAIINGLLGVGGTAAGALVGGPAGAAIGGKVGSSLAPTTSNATTLDPRYNGLPQSLSLR
jgi:hypothetical protein